MAKPPITVGLVFCESMELDPSLGRLSLSGVFNDLRFSGPPPFRVEFTAYAALFGGEGEGKIELVVSRMETEEVVYRYERWQGNPDPSQVRHLELRLQRCAFPAPGRYGCQLRFDNEDLTWRPLNVYATGRMR
jgi:hypothetical protein